MRWNCSKRRPPRLVALQLRFERADLSARNDRTTHADVKDPSLEFKVMDHCAPVRERTAVAGARVSRSGDCAINLLTHLQTRAQLRGCLFGLEIRVVRVAQHRGDQQYSSQYNAGEYLGDSFDRVPPAPEFRLYHCAPLRKREKNEESVARIRIRVAVRVRRWRVCRRAGSRACAGRRRSTTGAAPESLADPDEYLDGSLQHQYPAREPVEPGRGRVVGPWKLADGRGCVPQFIPAAFAVLLRRKTVASLGRVSARARQADRRAAARL